MAIEFGKSDSSSLPSEEGYFLGPKGEKICMGFIWQPFGQGGARSKNLEKRVKKFSGSHYILVNSPQGQQLGTFYYPAEGLGEAHCGALLMQKVLGEDWIGLFEVNANSYWVVGAYQGAFVSGVDNLFQNLEEASARFDMFSGYFAWKKFYVSPGLLKSKQSSIEEVDFMKLAKNWPLNEASRVHSLADSRWPQALKVRLHRTFFLLGMALALLGALGFSRWKHWSAQRLAQQRALQMQALELKRSLAWKQEPSMTGALQVGLEALRSLPIQMGGWRLNSGKWDGQALSVVYKPQNVAFAEELQKSAQALGFECKVDDKKKTATLKKALKGPAAAPETQLRRLAELQPQLQNLYHSLKVEGELKPLALPAQGQAALSLSLKSGLAPEALLASVDLTGMVVQEISFSVQSGPKILWKILGRVYAKS